MADLFEIAFVIFILYILYKLVFELIVPVSKATTQFKTKMHTMQQEQTRRQPQTSAQPQKQPVKPSHEDDYIEFEEVK